MVPGLNLLTLNYSDSIPYRWLGFLLMNVGEMGNFISYAFAPASVVAPLGTVRQRVLTASHTC